jgi:transcriptional regulator with XRE-family HTH domain
MENEARTERLVGLYAAMWSKGLTQTRLAEKSGIPRSLLSMIMTGRLRPYPRQIEKIVEVLGEDTRAILHH